MCRLGAHMCAPVCANRQGSPNTNLTGGETVETFPLVEKVEHAVTDTTGMCIDGA